VWQTSNPYNPQLPTPAETPDLEQFAEDWDRWEKIYQEEQELLPPDLRGQFRFGIKPEQMADKHPRLKRLFSFTNATTGEIDAFRTRKIVEKWGKHFADTGSDAVQIAILTMRINRLITQVTTNVKDKANYVRLIFLVNRRKALLKHLKKTDLKTYYALLADIKLKDDVEIY